MSRYDEQAVAWVLEALRHEAGYHVGPATLRPERGDVFRQRLRELGATDEELSRFHVVTPGLSLVKPRPDVALPQPEPRRAARRQRPPPP